MRIENFVYAPCETGDGHKAVRGAWEEAEIFLRGPEAWRGKGAFCSGGEGIGLRLGVGLAERVFPVIRYACSTWKAVLLML